MGEHAGLDVLGGERVLPDQPRGHVAKDQLLGGLASDLVIRHPDAFEARCCPDPDDGEADRLDGARGVREPAGGRLGDEVDSDVGDLVLCPGEELLVSGASDAGWT